MRDLITNGETNRNSLSERMADNVVEAAVAYQSAPGTATAEQVTTLSVALQALSTLAIAEQLQAIIIQLQQLIDATASEFDEDEAPA